MPAKFKVTVDQPRWQRVVNEAQFPIATAGTRALQQTASDSVDEGRRNIASAGRFGANWQRDLTFTMFDAVKNGQPSLDAKALIYHKSALAFVFERGITIQGKTLLWIPTSTSTKFPTPSQFIKRGGRLTAATVHGTPVLFDANDKDRKRKPLYIGVPSVRIAKKWHIIEIVKEHATKIPELFARFFKGD